jgi:hypothetical protein
VIFLLDVVHSLLTKLPQKYWMKITFSWLPGGFKVIQTPQIVAGGVSGLKLSISRTRKRPAET